MRILLERKKGDGAEISWRFPGDFREIFDWKPILYIRVAASRPMWRSLPEKYRVWLWQRKGVSQ